MAAAEQIAIEVKPEAQEESGAFDTRQPLFSEKQQAAFDAAFRKMHARLIRRYEPIRNDLMDTLGLLEQVFERAVDRLSDADARAIAEGIAAIKLAYEGDKWKRS